MFLLHQLYKTVKQIGAVLWAGRALRVILNAEYTICLALHALHRIVQQIDMGALQGCFLKAAGIHGIGMVLRGNFNLSCSQILYRMVSSAMTEFQLVGLCAIGQSDDLVPRQMPNMGYFPRSPRTVSMTA